MTRTAFPVLVATALILAVAGVWLAFDNPEVDSRGRAGAGYDVGPAYQCDAPYDTVLLDSSNAPGGEPTATDGAIAADCRAAGTRRFALATGAGGLAVVALVGAGVQALRRRRDPVPSTVDAGRSGGVGG